MILQTLWWLSVFLGHLGHLGHLVEGKDGDFFSDKARDVIIHMNDKNVKNPRNSKEHAVKLLNFCVNCPDPEGEGSITYGLLSWHNRFPDRRKLEYEITGDVAFVVPNYADHKKILNGFQLTNRIALVRRGKIPLITKVKKILQYSKPLAILIYDDGQCDPNFRTCGARVGNVHTGGFSPFDEPTEWEFLQIPVLFIHIDTGLKLEKMMTLRETDVLGMGLQNITTLSHHSKTRIIEKEKRKLKEKQQFNLVEKETNQFLEHEKRKLGSSSSSMFLQGMDLNKKDRIRFEATLSSSPSIKTSSKSRSHHYTHRHHKIKGNYSENDQNQEQDEDEDEDEDEYIYEECEEGDEDCIDFWEDDFGEDDDEKQYNINGNYIGYEEYFFADMEQLEKLEEELNQEILTVEAQENIPKIHQHHFHSNSPEMQKVDEKHHSRRSFAFRGIKRDDLIQNLVQNTDGDGSSSNDKNSQKDIGTENDNINQKSKKSSTISKKETKKEAKKRDKNKNKDKEEIWKKPNMNTKKTPTRTSKEEKRNRNNNRAGHITPATRGTRGASNFEKEESRRNANFRGEL